MELITKALCPLFGTSTITVLLLAIQRLARYRISRSLLLWLILLAIRIQRKLNWREGGIIGRLRVTDIGGHLLERYVWIGISGTAMTVWFGFGGGTTTVNMMDVTALHRIMTPSFVSLEMFSILLVHNNDDWLGYNLAAMIPFMPLWLYKRYDMS